MRDSFTRSSSVQVRIAVKVHWLIRRDHDFLAELPTAIRNTASFTNNDVCFWKFI